MHVKMKYFMMYLQLKKQANEVKKYATDSYKLIIKSEELRLIEFYIILA